MVDHSVMFRCRPGRRRRAIAPALWALAVLGLGSGAVHAQTAAPKVVLAKERPRYVGPVATGGSAPGLRAEFSIGRSPQAALASVAPYFGIANPASELREIRRYVRARAGTVHRYRQLHFGLPIVGAELVMATDDAGRFESLSGEVASSLALAELTPQVTPAAARDTALRAAAKYHGLPPFALVATEPELSIYRPELLGPSAMQDDLLVWQLEVSAPGAPVDEYVLIDARTGALALHFNQVDSALDRMTYTTNGTSTLPGTLLCDETQPDCTEGVSLDADFAHLYVGHTYDFYFDRFGRDSFDGAGATIVTSVDYGPSTACPNAFWDGMQMQMAFCPGGPMADDVVAHELSHAVTQYTSDLFYWHQSGAINESMSDVFGEILDQTNGAGSDGPEQRWLMGEDWAALGVIRNMENPPQFNDPDRMGSPLYVTTAADNGGVHSNSGVNNKAAALLVDGGTFNGYEIDGIGLDKTAALYYRVQTQHLTSGSDYADLYIAMNQACQAMMAAVEVDAEDCFEVAKATAAVEMNRDPAVREGSEAAVCPVGQVPTDFYANGFETDGERALWDDVALSGSASWAFATGFATDGELAAYAEGAAVASDHALEMSAGVTLPADAFLRFRHSFYQEFAGADYYDGGFVEISNDDGATWSEARDFYADGQDYGGALFAATGNPQAGHDAFVADSRGYVSTRYDLAALAGDTVRIRFRNTSDTSISMGLAWLVDEVRIYTCAEDPSPNIDPVADAGDDVTVAPLAGVALSGTNSRDDDGTLESYEWAQLSGPVVMLTSGGAGLEFVAPATPIEELLEFALTVTDNRGATATDTVVVTVVNEPPTADAGPDLELKPLEAAQLSVTASDGDGSIVSYVWNQTAGPDVALSSEFVQFPTFFAPPVVTQEVLEFDVSAFDNFGAVAIDHVVVTVTNDQPTIEMDPAQTIRPREILVIKGIASDEDGGIVAYAWVQTAGPAVTLVNPTFPEDAWFEAPSVPDSEVLTFALTATDQYGATVTGTVDVTVINDPPTSDAGTGSTVAAGASVALTGRGTDANGTIASYRWTQLSGPSVSLSTANTSRAQFLAPSLTSSSALVFELEVTDNDGGTGTDTVTITVQARPPEGGGGGGGGSIDWWMLIGLIGLWLRGPGQPSRRCLATASRLRRDH